MADLDKQEIHRLAKFCSHVIVNSAEYTTETAREAQQLWDEWIRLLRHPELTFGERQRKEKNLQWLGKRMAAFYRVTE